MKEIKRSYTTPKIRIVEIDNRDILTSSQQEIPWWNGTFSDEDEIG